jgi:restriction system protein
MIRTIPSYDAFMNPVLKALHNLGGSGTIQEINDEVSNILALEDQQLEIIHDATRGSQTEVEYRLHWARTYLKKYGLIENSSRGIWALTPPGRDTERIDEKEVRRYVKSLSMSEHSAQVDEIEEAEKILSWREELMNTLLTIEPSGFERLFQRMLRESGFTQVEVTGRTNDGGIDGKGLLRLGGFLSFHVMFQCKRWQGSVGASVVRDFRGAMVGRADKGLLVTTGTFTKEAVSEATRDGAPPIDLINGEQLINKLKELRLGVKTEIEVIEVEKINIDQEWFFGI